MRRRYLEARRRAALTQASLQPLWSLTRHVVLNVSCRDGYPRRKEAFGLLFGLLGRSSVFSD